MLKAPRSATKIASLVVISAVAVGTVPALVSGLHAQAVQPAPALTEEAKDRGRELFVDTGCIQCHALADAGGASSYAPSLDGNPELSTDLVRERVDKGRGDMPSFAGILSDAEIAQLASYIVAVAEKPS